MDSRTLSLSGLGCLFIMSAASAGLPGNPHDLLVLEQHDTYMHEGDTYRVLRLYAQFEEQGSVTFWGSETGFTITNDLFSQGDALGSGFWATAVADVLPPEAGGLYDLFPEQFDNSTYLTIGVQPGYGDSEVSDVFDVTPGFDPDIIGEASLGGIGGVVSNPGAPNTLSGPDGRVLLAQFTVLDGECVTGSGITVSGEVDGEAFNVQGLTFGVLTCVTGPPCVWDLDASGRVDVADLLIVLDSWGETKNPADLDFSGTVDVGDLLILLANWGPCP